MTTNKRHYRPHRDARDRDQASQLVRALLLLISLIRTVFARNNRFARLSLAATLSRWP